MTNLITKRHPPPSTRYTRRKMFLNDLALMHAATSHNTLAVKTILAMPGLDVNRRDDDGYTALMRAATYGHLEAVKILLEHIGIYFVNRGDDHGQNALIAAARNNRTDVLDLLLHRDGVDTNLADNTKMTALHYAAWHGHTHALQMLLNCTDSHGVHVPVDLNRVNDFGQTALMLACERPASSPETITIIQLLLAEGADRLDVNTASSVSGTALHAAARAGNVEAVRLLLAHGWRIEVDVEDAEGETALVAVEGRHGAQFVEIVAMLKEAGAA